MSVLSERKGAFSVLARPHVRRWVLARLAAGAAVTALRATVLWQIDDLTHSTALLGLMGLLAFLPAPFASLTGGLLADAYKRKHVVLAAQLVELSCAIGLTVLAMLPSFPLWMLYAVFIVNGVALVSEAPARQAMLPTLVPPEELPRAVTVMSTGQALSMASGPAIAGLLIAWRGPRASCIASLALLALSFLMVLRVEEGRRSELRPAVGLTALKEGLSFVLKNRIVLGALSIDLFAVVFGGAAAMLPVYARDVLDVGAHGYGLLAACLDVGALCTSLVMVFMPPIQRLGRAIMISVVAYGMATIAFGLSRSFPLSLLFYFLVGVADQVSVVSRSTLVQLTTPDELRGRVSSVNIVFIVASNQLAIAESGFIAELTSPTFAVVSGGILVFVVVAVVAMFIPELWRGRAVPPAEKAPAT